MATSAAGHANRKSFVLMGILGIALVAPAVTLAQEPAPAAAPSPAPSRVRAGDSASAALLKAGLARSATFRAIVEAIDRSDLIVYIETRPIRLPGQLQLVAATPGCRHLRISIRTPGLDTEMVAWLGHELWHAVELAGARDVTDQSSLLRFYKRIGHGSLSGTSTESFKAQEV